MRHVFSLLLSSLLVSVAGCGGDVTTQGPEEPNDASTTKGTPASFETWLVEQCPNGAAVHVADRDGNKVRVVACESLRERALADPAMHDQLVMAYMAQSEETPTGEQSNVRGKKAEGDGEPIGATSEPLTPIGGLACALVALGPGLIFGWPGRGCEHARNPRDRRACDNVTGGFTVGAGILCTIAAFF